MAGSVWTVDFFTGYEGFPTPPPDDLGCAVFVTSVTGWAQIGDPRVDKVDRPAGDGTLDSRPTLPGKAVTITGTVKAPNQISLLTWMDRFTGLLTDGGRTGVLTGQEPHLTRYLTVELGGEAIPTPVSLTECKFSMILYAPDPRRFGAQLTVSTGLPKVAGGLILPFTLPFTLNSVVVTGQASLVNPGTAVGPVLMNLYGPIVGVSQITHVGTGATLVFASSLSLSAGQWLEIDMENHRVLANGQVPRAEYVTSRGWSGFERGANTWALSAQNYSASAHVDIFATPAWN